MYSDMMCVCCAEIREAFRVLDRDGNGFISKQELGMAMRSLGYMPSEVELAIIMQRLDMDGEALHKDTHLGACIEQACKHTKIQKGTFQYVTHNTCVMFVYSCCVLSLKEVIFHPNKASHMNVS